VNRKSIDLILLFILGSIWGTGTVINKYVMVRGIDPISYTFWQFIGPGIILFFITYLKKELRYNHKHILFYLTCGIIGLAIPSLIIHLCALKLPAGILPVVINTVPIIVYPLSVFFKQEKFTLIRFIAVVLGVCGILILLVPKANVPLSWFWPLFASIAPLCFAINSLFVNPNRPKNSNALTLATGMLLSSAIVMLPFLLYIQHDLYIPIFPLAKVDYILILRMFMHCLGYVIYFSILKRAGPVYYSLVSGIVILSGLFWAYYIHQEVLNIYQAIAIVLVVAGIYILTYSRKKT
jgi:drug/metabolite transporter (DMT)-like permease